MALAKMGYEADWTVRPTRRSQAKNSNNSLAQ
jgi:hypothetical protein